MSTTLQAFTESGLKAASAKQEKRSKSNSRTKTRSSFTTSSKSKPRPKKPISKQRGGKRTKETIVFDDAKRNEFLTGFSKRKTARKEAAKKFAEAKLLEERKAARKEARQARKEQAAENVRAERRHFAGSGDEGGSEEGGDDPELQGWEEPDAQAPPPPPQSFETSSHLTTVTIQPFDLDEEPTVNDSSHQPSTTERDRNPLKRKATSTIDILPPSSRRLMKREKNEKERMKLEKELQKKKKSKDMKHKKPSEKEITNLLEPEINTEILKPPPPSTSLSSKQVIQPSSNDAEGSTKTLEGKRKEKAFRYETKLERAKQRAHNADQRAKRKEKRIQEVESMKGVKGFIPKGGKTKQGMRKKSGKAGSGGIGKKTGSSSKKK